MSRTSLLQHIRQTSQDRKAKRGTVNAAATVLPQAPSTGEPRPDREPFRYGSPEATLDERFENLAPSLSDSRKRLLALVDDSLAHDAFTAATEPPAPKPTSPRRVR